MLYDVAFLYHISCPAKKSCVFASFLLDFSNRVFSPPAVPKGKELNRRVRELVASVYNSMTV